MIIILLVSIRTLDKYNSWGLNGNTLWFAGNELISILGCSLN